MGGRSRSLVGDPSIPEVARAAIRATVIARAYEIWEGLQRRRSEVVERTFAHVCETGGARRSWLRGIERVAKRYLLQAAAHNLGLVLRKLLGAGKPREFAAWWGSALRLWGALVDLLRRVALYIAPQLADAPAVGVYTPISRRLLSRTETRRISTGC